MSIPVIDLNAPMFTRQHINLADAELGAKAISCSDEFFAPLERMLNPEPAVFIPGKYDLNGKWMDGWETRRKRTAGTDWAIIQLFKPAMKSKRQTITQHGLMFYPLKLYMVINTIILRLSLPLK